MTSAVERGASLLDEKRPGWENEIDVDRLDMNNFKNCVLGQVYGEYDAGLVQLGIRILSTEAIRSGFDAVTRESCPETTFSGRYNALTEDWKQQIADRQPQAA